MQEKAVHLIVPTAYLLIYNSVVVANEINEASRIFNELYKRSLTTNLPYIIAVILCILHLINRYTLSVIQCVITVNDLLMCKYTYRVCCDTQKCFSDIVFFSASYCRQIMTQ